MQFTQIKLTDYKNYHTRSFSFDERIVAICGRNGKGKTNLLDAIHYLCFTKSYFNKADQLNTRFNTEGFRLEGTVLKDSKPNTIVCVYRTAGKKEISLNDIPYKKFSHHIGKFPSVFIAPDDIALITGKSEDRRKFIDMLISQVHESYLEQLIIYNKLLSERNALLRMDPARHRWDAGLLDAIDRQLISAGNFVFTERAAFCQKLFPLIQKFYDRISGAAETISIKYESQLHEGDFQTLLSECLSKDRMNQRTNVGLHKDDLVFELKENPFKQIASQGQRKSLLFACKLSEFEILKKEKGFTPVLLLDDVFEKLDAGRIRNLLQFICEENDGQVFITDTDSGRLSKVLTGFTSKIEMIELDDL